MSYETFAHFAKLGGTVFFSVSFLIAMAYALWPKNQTRFEQAAQMPLNSDDHPKI